MGMHDHLWAGVDRRLADALSSFDAMARSLQPPARTQRAVALESAGASIAHPWQDTFWAHIDTFLTKVRSVPDVIECCFGADRSPPMRDWFDGRPPIEQVRRKTFSYTFRSDRDAFRQHPLTTVRNSSEHRRGFPDVEGKIIGPFGTVHIATPTQRVPDAESRPLEAGNINSNAALQWAAALPPRPIEPKRDQFTIAGKPLFPECHAYLTLARDLRAKAQSICDEVHGNRPLSTPPDAAGP
jgi:hypothetical protein